MSDIAISDVEAQYRGKTYADLKSELAEAIINALSPIQEKYHELARHPDKIMEILAISAKNASETANVTMQTVRERIGLLGKK